MSVEFIQAEAGQEGAAIRPIKCSGPLPGIAESRTDPLHTKYFTPGIRDKRPKGDDIPFSLAVI